MKLFLNVTLTLFTLAMGFWAYQQNYATKNALREVSRLQSAIHTLKQEQAILNAEWAYLNRPERLRELVDINFAELKLLPLLPSQFGRVEQIAFPNETPNGRSLGPEITSLSGGVEEGQ